MIPFQSFWGFKSKQQITHDQLWLSAFKAGYEKAWDTMLPIMMEGVEKSKKSIHDIAVDETLERLESVIVSRIEQSGKYELKSVNEIFALKKRIEGKVATEKDQNEKERFIHHLEVIGWVLDGHTVR